MYIQEDEFRTKMSPQPRIKLSRLRDIGWRLWDPIGLLAPEDNWDDNANQSFADEYDKYLIAAASQLRSGTAREQVAEYLIKIETTHMGLSESASTQERAMAVVEALLTDKSIWSMPE